MQEALSSRWSGLKQCILFWGKYASVQEWASAGHTFVEKHASMQEVLSVARVARARLPDGYSTYFAQYQNKVCTALTHSCGRTGPPAYFAYFAYFFHLIGRK